jgi:hypothetical protein
MTTNRRGAILVEVLLAAGLLAVIIVPLLNFFVAGIESSWFATREVRAQTLAREAWESVRSVRERNWLEITDGTFYPESSSGAWQLVASTTGEDIGPFNRKIEIAPAYRNAAGEIVDTGGTLDQATKTVTIEVAWTSLRSRLLSLTTYLTRHLDNLIWTQTTQAEFDLGEKEYVETTLVNDGEVQLQGGCENPAGAAIYDELFQNTWQVHPSAKNDIKEVTQPPGQVYEGVSALELKAFAGADTKLRNQDNICTLGFTHFDFYAYSSATVEQSFQIGGDWQGGFIEVVLPPQSWEFFSIPYADVSGGNEVNLSFLFFKEGNTLPSTVFYLDNMTLTGGVGGFFSQGTLVSAVAGGEGFNANRETTFNRIFYTADIPSQTEIGFQVATSNHSSGPWIFYGPGGTTSESDLYTDPAGEGIWLGNNFGQYCRYKAYLRSNDGVSTPVLHDVSINYAP